MDPIKLQLGGDLGLTANSTPQMLNPQATPTQTNLSNFTPKVTTQPTPSGVGGAQGMGQQQGTITTGPTTPNLNAAKTYAESINKAAASVKSSVESSAEPDVNGDTTVSPDKNSSAFYLSEIKNLASNQPAQQESQFELGTRLRQEYGLDEEQAVFLEANAELQDLKAQKDIGYQTANNRMISLGERGQAKDAVTTKFEDRERFLIAKKQAAADAMQAKMSTINQIMDWKNTDFQNARQYFNDNWNRNMSMYETLNGAEQKEENKARSNFNTAFNAIKESGISFDKIDPMMKANLSQWAAQSGLPTEFPEFLMNLPEKREMAFHTTGYDADGNQQVSVFYKNPDGSISTPVRISTGFKKQTEEDGADTSSKMSKNIGKFFSPETQRDLLASGLDSSKLNAISSLGQIGKIEYLFSPDKIPVTDENREFAEKMKSDLKSISLDNISTLADTLVGGQDGINLTATAVKERMLASQTKQYKKGTGRDTGILTFVEKTLNEMPEAQREKAKKNIEKSIKYGAFGSADYKTAAGDPKNADKVADAIATALFNFTYTELKTALKE